MRLHVHSETYSPVFIRRSALSALHESRLVTQQINKRQCHTKHDNVNPRSAGDWQHLPQFFLEILENNALSSL